MSHSLWYDDEQLAGPSCNSTPLSFVAPNPPYKIVFPDRQDPPSHAQPSGYSIPQLLRDRSRSCIDAADQYVIRPHFHFPAYDGEALKKMHQFHDRFRHDTYNGHQFNSTILAGSPRSSIAEDLDADLSGVPWDFLPRMQRGGSYSTFRRDASAIRLPLYRQEATSSFLSYHSVTPEKLTESPSPHGLVTPKFEETDDSHLDLTIQNRPQTLSPYAPMPLQPIFQLEPQSKTMHDTIEPIPYDPVPLCNTKRTKSPPIDPLLIPYEEEVPGPVGVSFARGSIAPRDLWHSSTVASKSPVSNHHNFCFPTAIDIPLEIAKHYAQEFRASSPHTQLSQQFLLSFMGQSVGNSPWTCYILGCGKQLTRKSHMVDHIRMHLDERVYACSYCPQTFLRKADCKRHSVAHNPEKAFQCDLCNKSFGRKDLLTRHKRKCDSKCSSTSGHTLVSIKGLSRKRKAVHENSIIATQGTQNVMYVAGSLFEIPPEHFKRNNRGFILESNEANKENIPPSPGERLRKKARVLF